MKNFTLLLMYGSMHTNNATITTNKIKTTTKSTATNLSTFNTTTTTTISATRATKCCGSYKLLLLLLVLLLPFVSNLVPKVSCNTSGNSRSSNCSLVIKTTTADKGCSTIAKETRTTAAAIAVFDNILLLVLNDFAVVTANSGRNNVVVVNNNNICKVQLQQSHYHDNKTDGHNIDSNTTKIFAAYATPFVVVVAYKVNSDSYNNIIFYCICMLALHSLREFLATFLRKKKEQQQQKHCQDFVANESSAAAATSATNAALALTVNAALSTAFSILLSNKSFALHTTLMTMKTTTTKRTALTIEQILFILGLLQQFCTQERKQEQQQLQQTQRQQQEQQQQYDTSNQQQMMYTNCSKHCGNMYQKQQQQKQQLNVKISAHQQHLVAIHNVLLFHKQFAVFSHLVGVIIAKPALTFYCIQNERIRRRRRRKRKLLQLISNSNSCCIRCNYIQHTLIKQQKRLVTSSAAGAATVPKTGAVATSNAVTAAVKKYGKCCCYTQNQRAGCQSSENSANFNCRNRDSNNNDNNDSSCNRHNNNSNNNNHNESSLRNNKNNNNSSSSSSSSSNGDSNNNHCNTCCCCLCCYYCSSYHCSDCSSCCCYACCCSCCCSCWCCCCYCCCYCCCCCCCYYCFARSNKSSSRHCHCSFCCCLCQQFKATNMSNNTNANNNKTNSNSNGKYSGFKVQDNNNCNSCYNNTNSSSNININSGTSKPYGWQQQRQRHYYYHQQQQQQQQQHYYKEYYQQQHKRQQQQHLFYQQHNCYHRRRRRHFCASYTSLHSCCCCFFKWICWRHQNLHNCHTVAAAAKQAASNANIVNIFRQQSALTSQITQVPTATNANIKKVNATCRYCCTCNQKWKYGCCCYYSVSKTLKQQQQQRSQKSFTATAATTSPAALPKRPATLVVTKTKEALLNLSAFRTITATAISTLTATVKTETPPTTATTRILPEKTRASGQTLIATSLLSTGRMCRRLPFRCNWLWLIIGLVWLEGPKLAACNISWQINSSNSSSNNDNASNNRSTAAATDAALNSTTQQALYYTTTAATTTTTPTATFMNCSSSTKCTQNTAAIFHKNVNQIPTTRQKQRFQRRTILATATTKMFEIKNGHRFPVADSTQWSDLTMKAREAENRQQSDDVRLESIKSQILSRLGLKRKPNITHPLPKQFIWDTIYRADGISSVIDFDFNDDHRRQRIISSRDSQKFVKYFATPSVHPFNEATTSHRTTAMTNSRVTRAYGTFFSNTNDANGNGDRDGYGGDSSDIGNVDDNKNNDNEQQHQTFVYQRMRQQQQREYKQQQQQNLRYPKEKLSSYLSYSDSYGTVHADQSKARKTLNFNNEANSEQQQRYQQHDDGGEKDSYESEEFYGITQEIILFAEKGKMYKKHRLVEFSPPTHDIPSRKLQIRHAEIHIRIERTLLSMSMQQRRRRNTKLKLWIFQLVDSGDYTQRGFDQVARLCTSLNVEYHTLGWQKLDLTETVQLWYDQKSGEKLRLLIDCTGCGQHFVLHLFDVQNQTAQDEMQQHQGKKSNQSGARKKQHMIRTKNETEITAKTAIEQQTFRKQHAASRGKISKNNNKNNKHHQYKQLLDHYDYKSSAINVDSQQQQAAAATMSNVAADEFYHLDDRLNPNRPFLVLHTEPKRARRVRRRVIDCAGAQHGQCCKESFYVSFKALGWDDWIIAPRGYFANYCRGDCTGPYRTPDTFQTFHAHFIEEYRKMGLLNGMQPCCAPIKFSSMSLIYYGDDGIIKRDLPKMVVDECGCP